MRGKIWIDVRLLKVVFVFNMIISLTFAQTASAGTVESGFTNNLPCSGGYIDFESGTDGAVIGDTLQGVQFTTSGGVNWKYADMRTGQYNAPYSPGNGLQYWGDGNFVAWLGESGSSGRIDFTDRPANYFSILVSTYSGVALEAYDANNNPLDRTPAQGLSPNNLNTGTMDKLTVTTPYNNIAYVIIHDAGDYFIVDDICTDALVEHVGENQIPEFPTIAFPVIAVIGLVFLFQKRKGK